MEPCYRQDYHDANDVEGELPDVVPIAEAEEGHPQEAEAHHRDVIHQGDGIPSARGHSDTPIDMPRLNPAMNSRSRVNNHHPR